MKPILTALALVTASEPAWGAGCNLYDQLQSASPEFQLATITGPGHIALAPDDAAPGQPSPYLIAGDPVVVLGAEASRSCVAFTAPSKAARTTVGWVAAASLAPADATPGSAADWVGLWHSGPEQTIALRLQGPRLHVSGDATYGATDPDRVRRGGVNLGSLDGWITPAGGQAAYSEGDDTACHVRFWQLGPYLVAADNGNCGGHNVSFSGVYRRRPR